MFKELVFSGHNVLISNQDLKFIQSLDCFISYSNGVPYLMTKIDGFLERIHILISKNSGIYNKDLVIDHINQNSLDNRRDNLRSITQHQNTMRKGHSKNNTSGYRGVVFDKRTNKWMSKIKYNYKDIYLGRYNTKEEAACIYNTNAIKYFGEFAVLNEVGHD